jgi:hypothetical protein
MESLLKKQCLQLALFDSEALLMLVVTTLSSCGNLWQEKWCEKAILRAIIIDTCWERPRKALCKRAPEKMFVYNRQEAERAN